MEEHVNEIEYVSLLESDYNELMEDIDAYTALTDLLTELLNDNGISFVITPEDISARIRANSGSEELN